LGVWVKIEHTSLAEEGILGDSTVTKRVIRIEKTLEGGEYLRVLRHECMHMKLGISGLSDMLNKKQEEALCVLAETS